MDGEASGNMPEDTSGSDASDGTSDCDTDSILIGSLSLGLAVDMGGDLSGGG